MAITKIGMIGLDTSHCTAFARLLHDTNDPNHIPGAKIVAGYPGATATWDKSAGRVDGFTATLRDEYGVAILDSPEAVAGACDLVMITAVDGRQHRAFFERIVASGKPTFIDKPFAITAQDAQAMLQLSEKHGVALMSCSALRYAEPFQAALRDDALGPIQAIDVFGPMALDDVLPGLFWYGCHGIEMVMAAMGTGCRAVRAMHTPTADLHTLIWDDGRIASYRGIRGGAGAFGATLHREKGFQSVDISTATRPYYVDLLQAVLGALPQGRSDVPTEQMLEAVQLMEAGNRARETGELVSLTP